MPDFEITLGNAVSNMVDNDIDFYIECKHENDEELFIQEELWEMP